MGNSAIIDGEKKRENQTAAKAAAKAARLTKKGDLWGYQLYLAMASRVDSLCRLCEPFIVEGSASHSVYIFKSPQSVRATVCV